MANERLIDAEPIKKFIENGLNHPIPLKAFGHDAIEILAEIEYAPTVDAVPVVHGRWEPARHDTLFQCSECGYVIEPVETNYCPNCGAKMDGGKSE